MGFNMVRYSQQDPQWKGDKIGGGPDTIGYIGCALTCVAMYISGWGYTETPGTLNKKLTARGGFIDEAIVWGSVTGIYPQVKSTGLTVLNNTDAPLAQIDSYLAAGNPVIVEVDYKPDPGLQTHWVVIYDKQGDDYLIQDPWPNPPETKQVTLMSRFAQGQPLKRAIKAVAWYQVSGSGSGSSGTSGGSSSTTPSMPPAVNTGIYVQPTADATAGLRLRTAGDLNADTIAIEAPGTQMQIIETGGDAKIGQQQWIYVRDPQGNQGFVAGWYVEKVGGAAPSSTPAPAGGSTTDTTSSSTSSTTTSSTPTTPPASVPQRFQVTVIATAGVRLRKQPSAGSPLVTVENAGTTLTVLDKPENATPKIGKAGQFILVRDSNGQRGYADGQYLQLKS